MNLIKLFGLNFKINCFICSFFPLLVDFTTAFTLLLYGVQENFLYGDKVISIM